MSVGKQQRFEETAPSRQNSRVAWNQPDDGYIKGQPQRPSLSEGLHAPPEEESRALSGRGRPANTNEEETGMRVKRSSSKSAGRRESKGHQRGHQHAALVPDEDIEALKRQLSQLTGTPAAVLEMQERAAAVSRTGTFSGGRTGGGAAAVRQHQPPTKVNTQQLQEEQAEVELLHVPGAGAGTTAGGPRRQATTPDEAPGGKRWHQPPPPPVGAGSGGHGNPTTHTQTTMRPTTAQRLAAAVRQCGRRLPRGCLAPLHTLLLMALLMGGVVPLYLYNLRLVNTAKTSSTFMCAVYPAIYHNVTYDLDSPGEPLAPLEPPDQPQWPNWPDFPPFEPPPSPPPPAPPAPPGGRGISSFSEADCERELQTLFDTNMADGNPWRHLVGLVRFGFTIQDVDPRKFVASAIVDFALPPFSWPSCKAVVLGATFNNDEEREFSCYEEYHMHGRRSDRSYLVQIEKVPVKVLRDLSLYPFDRYEFSLTAELRYVDTRETGVVADYDYKTYLPANNTMFVPFVSRLVTRSPAFSFEVPRAVTSSIQVNAYATNNGSLTWAYGGSQVSYTVLVKRTLGVKAFVVLVFAAMWGLALFALVHTLDTVVLRPRATAAVGYDAPAYAAAMLFALPGVRQMLPGVPDMGAMVDICGFYWNMAILALVCCMYVARIYAQSRGINGSGSIDDGCEEAPAARNSSVGGLGSAKVLPV